MSELRTCWDWLAVNPHQRKGLRVLQAFLGAVLVFRMATEIRFAPFLWGPHGIGHGTTVTIFGPLGKVFDAAYGSAGGVTCVAVAGAFSGMLLLLGKQTRTAAFTVFLVLEIVEIRLPELCDGGDNVARLVLGYMIFCLPNSSKAAPRSLRVWLHNIAILAIGAQLCVLYFTSGFMKMTGERWTHGVATYLISQVEWFSLPASRDLFKNPIVAMVSAYATVLFQFWFPVAIFTRARLAWLFVGLCFHIGIAVMMGLVTFSLTMAGLELFLVTDHEWQLIERASRTILARVVNPSARAVRGLRQSLSWAEWR